MFQWKIGHNNALFCSVMATIFSMNIFPWSFISRLLPGMSRFREMVDNTVWNGTFKGKAADKDYAISVFNSHIEEVKAVVPANRYVSYNAFCFISLSGLFWSFVSYTLM